VEDSADYIEWDFTSFTPVRKDVLGEVIVTRHWLARVCRGTAEICNNGRMKVDKYFIDNHPDEFPVLGILARDGGYPEARATRVASSLIRWLGAPMGLCFLDECERQVAEIADFMGERQKAYLAAWAIWNRPGASGDVRRYLLHNQNPTVDDWETMDKVIMWLGSDPGQAFLKEYRKELQGALLHKRRHTHQHQPAA
jgi:hypothetical protein